MSSFSIIYFETKKLIPVKKIRLLGKIWRFQHAEIYAFLSPSFSQKFSVSIARSLQNWNERNRAIARIFNKLILANPIFSLSSPLLRNQMAECPQTILSNASSDPKSTELLPCPCNIHKHQHESFSDLSHGLHQIQYPPKYFHVISVTMPYNE